MRHRIKDNFYPKQNKSSVNYFPRKIIVRVTNFYFLIYVLTFTQNYMVVKNLVTSFNSWSFCWLQLSLFPNKVWQISSCFTRPCPGKLHLSIVTTVTESGRFQCCIVNQLFLLLNFYKFFESELKYSWLSNLNVILFSLQK